MTTTTDNTIAEGRALFQDGHTISKATGAQRKALIAFAHSLAVRYEPWEGGTIICCQVIKPDGYPCNGVLGTLPGNIEKCIVCGAEA